MHHQGDTFDAQARSGCDVGELRMQLIHPLEGQGHAELRLSAHDGLDVETLRRIGYSRTWSCIERERRLGDEQSERTDHLNRRVGPRHRVVVVLDVADLVRGLHASIVRGLEGSEELPRRRLWDTAGPGAHTCSLGMI